MSRVLIGLSIGSGLEGVDVALLRATGIGLAMVPAVAAAARVPFPPAARDAIRGGETNSPTLASPEFIRNVADTAVHATRQALLKAGAAPREAFAIGLSEATRAASQIVIPWPEVADRLAEQTGITVIHGFRGRDRAAGGSGFPIPAIADFLLFRSAAEDRLLIHLGSVSGVLLLAAGAKVSALPGFEAGPGNRLLDALIFHGTRGKERTDPGGKKAVQGRCVESLLTNWADHPHLTRKPPKWVHSEAFGRTFLLAAFEAARQAGCTLPDLLCTATHLAARAIGTACRTWLPEATAPRTVYLSGGGVRNGFWWQLVAQQFEGTPVLRLDDLGVPPACRMATAAALLAALTCDGVPGNLPMLTGAAGGRVLGQVVPGDGRNWAAVAAWIADQSNDFPRTARAA